MNQHLSDSDVAIFQEIVDIESFAQSIPSHWSYISYPHNYNRHQHIVIGFRNTYSFRGLDELGEESYKVEGVAVNSKTSRPALGGWLFINEDPLIYIVGVHLKSGNTHSSTRLKQVEAIKNHIEKKSLFPVLIAGDFNTQKKEFTGLNFDDVYFLEKKLRPLGLRRLENKASTYKTLWEDHCLDHFFLSEECEWNDSLWIYNVDNYVKNGDIKICLEAYYKEISDHLPIKASFFVNVKGG